MPVHYDACRKKIVQFPVLNILLHLAGKLFLVAAQPAEGGVRPAVEPLVDQPAGGLRDGEHEEGHYHLEGQEQSGAELPLDDRAEDVGGDHAGSENDDPAGGEGSPEG